jgi:hypothetical protein
MKQFRIAVSLFILIAGFASVAHADLDDFIRRVNQQAKEDITRFNAKLSAQFGVPVPQVDAILKRVAAPADAFMVLQLSLMSKNKPETVLQTYTKHRDKGWGVIAKELGIKPGSSEFHALKRGDFSLTGHREGSDDNEHGKGKGKGKGHNK